MKKSIVFMALVALPALLAAADSQPVAKPGRIHAPIIIRERHGSQVTSTNWSGYAVTGAKGSVTDVTASWVVPTVTCPQSPNQYSSFWVGIDGYSSNTVEQIGTDSDCVDGKPVYYAWFEFYPHPSVTIESVPVTPGDSIYAEVKSTGKGTFTVTIQDLTTRAPAFVGSAKVPSADQSSAEWIAEAPYSGGVLPLADFSSVYFGSDYTGQNNTCFATIGGNKPGPISAFNPNVDSITMDGASGTKAAPSSPLSSDGTSFYIQWSSSQ